LNGRRVPVPEDAALFPIDGDVDAATLVAELGDEYDELADADTDDPFHNAVLMLALMLARRLSDEAYDMTVLVAPDTRRSLALLHAIRVAPIHEIFLLALRIPEFSPQHGTSRDELLQRLFRLDVEGATIVLERIFPIEAEDADAAEQYGEPADYQGEGGQTYRMEHAQVFGPLRSLFELTRRTSAAVVHHAGYFG